MNHIIYNNQIDYSQIKGEKIFPFIFTLNAEESVLYPKEKQKQTFCYDIQSTEQQKENYADLGYFLFDICDNLTQKDIANIYVTINEQPETVVWDKNIEIKTPDNPDTTTGYTGLKFDFPLNKINSKMKIYLTMSKPFPLGLVNVCLFGDGATATGLTICGPVGDDTDTCDSVFYQKETVCVPVTITPFVDAGEAKVTCYGKAKIVQDCNCIGDKTSCSFNVKQDICVEIPLSFGANVDTGTAVVKCQDATTYPCNYSEEDSRSNRFFSKYK